MLPRPDRAAAIGRFYAERSDARALAERLMDLEADRTLGLIVADVLKESL
jgi:hypothetical protein